MLTRQEGEGRVVLKRRGVCPEGQGLFEMQLVGPVGSLVLGT